MRPTIQQIASTVAEIYAINFDAILGKNGTRLIDDARRSCYLLAREYGYTLTEIGESLNRHHASIIHSVRNARFFEDNEKVFADRMRQCRNMLLRPQDRPFLTKDGKTLSCPLDIVMYLSLTTGQEIIQENAPDPIHA